MLLCRHWLAANITTSIPNGAPADNEGGIMSALATCFSCGKSVLIQQVQHGQAIYCFQCRMTRGIEDPPAGEPKPVASNSDAGLRKAGAQLISGQAPAVKKPRRE